MKRPHILPAAVLAGTGLLLTGCAGGDGPDGGENEQTSVVFIQEVTGNDFSSSESCGAEAAAEELGWEYSTTGPNIFDATEQIKYVNSVAAKNPDGVLIGPDDSIALRAPMQQMKDAGITLVELDTALDDTGISISQISSDNVEGGALAAETTSDYLDDEGKVLIVGLRPGITTGDQRIAGFTEWMDLNAPGISIVSTEYDENDPAKSAAIVSAALSAHPDLDAVFAIDLNNVVGSVTGLRQAGATGQVKLVGFDAGPQQVKLLETGEVDAVISQSPYAMGYEGVQQLKNHFDGNTVEEKIATPLMVVTKDNLVEEDTQKFLYKPTCED